MRRWSRLRSAVAARMPPAAARDRPAPLRDVGFHKNVVLDAKAFRGAGVPTITVHSLDRGTARLLTEPYRDRGVAVIDWDSYAESARMLAFYLAYLDSTLQLRIDDLSERLLLVLPDFVVDHLEVRFSLPVLCHTASRVSGQHPSHSP